MLSSSGFEVKKINNYWFSKGVRTREEHSKTFL